MLVWLEFVNRRRASLHFALDINEEEEEYGPISHRDTSTSLSLSFREVKKGGNINENEDEERKGF